MSYQVEIKKAAQKALKKIPDPDYSRVKAAIYALAEDPRPPGYIKLKGRDGYRIRQGNYRIIYEIQDGALLVTVVTLGHRKDVYD